MKVQPIITLTNVKTGRVFKMSKTAYEIAKKHGMDKDWDVMPEVTKAPEPMPIINQHPEIESEPVTETKRKRKKSNENGETDNIS